MDQVKDIVRRAVDEKERALREQYDRILGQKLQGARAQEVTSACYGRPLSPRSVGCASLCDLAHFSLLPTEQYQAFAKFNEDYISRSLKGSCAPLRPNSLVCFRSIIPSVALTSRVSLHTCVRSDLGYVS